MADSEMIALSDEDEVTYMEDGAFGDMYSYVGQDGRTYQGYMPGEYLLPNDGAEQDRLDLGHNIYRLMLDGKLVEAPLRDPEHILDIGTGTGLWALQFAEENPNCEVIGTDLSMIQPLSWMPNCRFIQENSELQEWKYPHDFDLVHFRGMVANFNDVTTLMRKALDSLKPGGWIEFQDPGFDCQGFVEGSIDDLAVSKWLKLVCKGGAMCGRDLTKARHYRRQLEEVGFVDVCERKVNVPIGPWANGGRAKVIGVYMANAFHTGSVDAFKQFLTAGGELSEEEIEDLSAQVKSEVRNANLRWYTTMYVVYGRKPYAGEDSK